MEEEMQKVKTVLSVLKRTSRRARSRNGNSPSEWGMCSCLGHISHKLLTLGQRTDLWDG